MIKVFVADDHPLVRHGIRILFNAAPNCLASGEAATSAELLAKLARAACDVLILDLRMPGESGLELLKRVQALRPKMPVLIFSLHPEDSLALRLLRASVSTYRLRIFEKLGLCTNTDLTHYMLEHATMDVSMVPPNALPPKALLSPTQPPPEAVDSYGT